MSPNAPEAPTTAQATAANETKKYANQHIPSFLARSEKDAAVEGAIQVLHDGKQLTAASLRNGSLDISQPILVQDTPESIGMTVFRPPPTTADKGNTVTVRHIADVIGHLFPVRVMDVEHQEELQGWTMGDLVDYFEDEQRLHQQQQASASNNSKDHQQSVYDNHRFQRKAAQKASTLLLNDQRPKILNQISLEFSDTPLKKHVVSPQFVRDLDWIDNSWPSELRNTQQSYPAVKYYCLTSTAGCYTDFHVDFGGTSVWYHVLSGSKKFCLVAPTQQNLAIYEEWLEHSDQESIFLPDKIPNQAEVLTVTLEASQTLFIPAGWIHAVYTPDDSVVLGGNFLHGLDLPLQLQIDALESRTKVPDKFRFPFFRRMQFYAAGTYLQQLQNGGALSARELENMPVLVNALQAWCKEASSATIGAASTNNKSASFREAALSVASKTGCPSVYAFLQVLRSECQKAANGETVTTTGQSQQKATSNNSGMPSDNPFGRKGLMIIPPDGPPKAARDGHSLGSPKSPKIRLKLKAIGSSSKFKTDASIIAKPKEGSSTPDSGFRITISHLAKELHRPLPRAATTARKGKFQQDTERVDLAHDDDDWVPHSSMRLEDPDDYRINLSSKKTAAVAKKRRGHGSAGVTRPAKTATATKKAKTTSRQRLRKKFR